MKELSDVPLIKISQERMELSDVPLVKISLERMELNELVKNKEFKELMSMKINLLLNIKKKKKN